ncbi:twin-arginine translocase subunit TatC [Halobacteria archaeon AArc-curdl1]|uniref:Sec-independent protein translocase protein TatC n=1 Tax=Natronosalvus hydrolyticus TaxID=2979988 RepID=A0AAP2ZB95_9EURY|nr:twin-arginine translocase subunit TatC [Halobacteria archaeon AArc-curdl1]
MTAADADADERSLEGEDSSGDESDETEDDESDETADSDGDGSEDDDETADDVSDDPDDQTGTDDDDGDLEEPPERPEGDEEAEPPRAKTDGDGFGSAHDPERQEPTYPDPDEDIGGISTPPDDQEMPLADHIEEMVLRLAVVLLIGAAATAIALLWASQAIEFIWFNIFPGPTAEVPPPHVYHPLELWLTRIKVAALAGIMVSLPMFVYECYLFMRPGLYPHERKYYLAAVPTSVVLGAIGMLVSFVVVLPILFRYFTFYSEGSAEIAYALGETFNLVITLTGFLAIVFQIPLFIILAVMMGVTTRRWLADKRIYFWAAFAGLSFMFTFDPTLMAPIIVAIIMIVLFEGTLLLLKWVGR